MNTSYIGIKRKVEKLEEHLERGKVDRLEKKAEAVLVKLRRVAGLLNDFSSLEYFGLRARIQDIIDEVKSNGETLIDRMYPFEEEENEDILPLGLNKDGIFLQSVK